jgi:hypothetical protein
VWAVFSCPKLGLRDFDPHGPGFLHDILPVCPRLVPPARFLLPPHVSFQPLAPKAIDLHE